jgi:Rrf2 family protein
MGRVVVSAKADYALRAMLELAVADDALSAREIADRQGIPQSYLYNILHELQRAGVVVTRRGLYGGHRLARPAGEITIADVLRAIGPAAAAAPEPSGPPFVMRLADVWSALRSNVAATLEQVTLSDLLQDRGGVTTADSGPSG